MKKILAMLLALMLCVSMIACSDSSKKKDDDDKDEETTEAVATTTAEPKEDTKAPEATTKAPVVTTEAPVVTTEAPVVTTEAPVVTTEAPVVTTEEPVVTTEAPVVTTEEPVVTTEAPEEDDEPAGVRYTDYEDVVDAFFDAKATGDVDAFYYVVMDSYLIDAMVEDEDEFKEGFLAPYVLGFEDYDIYYAILDAYSLFDADFDYCVEYLVDNFGYPEESIEEVAFVELLISIEDEETEEEFEDYLVVIKVDGYWYASMPLGEELASFVEDEDDYTDDDYTDDDYTDDDYTDDEAYTDGEYIYSDGFIFDAEGYIVGTYDEDGNYFYGDDDDYTDDDYTDDDYTDDEFTDDEEFNFDIEHNAVAYTDELPADAEEVLEAFITALFSGEYDEAATYAIDPVYAEVMVAAGQAETAEDAYAKVAESLESFVVADEVSYEIVSLNELPEEDVDAVVMVLGMVGYDTDAIEGFASLNVEITADGTVMELPFEMIEIDGDWYFTITFFE